MCFCFIFQLSRLRHRSLKQSLARKAVRRAVTSDRTRARYQLQSLESSLKKYLHGPQLQFVMSQLQSSSKKARRFRWTDKDKSFALSLYHASPKAYRLLRKTFSLPTLNTLRKAMQGIKVYPGFNHAILEALRLKVAPLPTASKLVAVILDEMAIKEGLSYDKGRDMVEGFVEGKERRKEIANHALAFLVRGLGEKWKQPFGYFLTSGPMSGMEMKDLLLQGVDLLRGIDLIPIVVIADQGSNNRNLFETILGVTIDKPYFQHDGSKIFILYDPPHLLKNTRNNFKKHGFVIDGKDIVWDHVVQFYGCDTSKPIRMAPKLTKKHIDLPPFANLRVCLASQVLSHSVAAGMAVMAHWKIIVGSLNFYVCLPRLYLGTCASKNTSYVTGLEVFSEEHSCVEGPVLVCLLLHACFSYMSNIPVCMICIV